MRSPSTHPADLYPVALINLEALDDVLMGTTLEDLPTTHPGVYFDAEHDT